MAKMTSTISQASDQYAEQSVRIKARILNLQRMSTTMTAEDTAQGKFHDIKVISMSSELSPTSENLGPSDCFLFSNLISSQTCL